MKDRIKSILHEFQHHFPFTIFAVMISLIILAIYTELLRPTMAIGDLHAHGHDEGVNAYTRLFHVLHPIHVFLSAAATAAMFWRYDKRFIVAVLTGLFGSLMVCGISDIIFPYLGGLLLNMDMHLHICLLENPTTVLMFTGIGIATGICAASGMNTASVSKVAHAMHVMVSTGATILYLVGFGLLNWTDVLAPVFIIVTFSVIIPCCTSDIIFPLLLVNKKGVHMCLGHCEEDDQE